MKPLLYIENNILTVLSTFNPAADYGSATWETPFFATCFSHSSTGIDASSNVNN